MKVIRRGLLILCAAVLAIAAGIFAASCGKNTVTLSFETNGGGAVAQIEAESGSETTLPVPVREGFVFDGWFTAKELTGTAYNGTITVPDSDTTYYAAWTEGVLLTLDPAGGVLSGEAQRYLRPGANLADALKEAVPSKTVALANGSERQLGFGNWFYPDGRALGAFDVMPAEGLTLQARYTVEYTVRVFLQNLSQQEYVRSEENNRTFTDYVGAVVSPDLSVFGFIRTEENAGQPSELTLTEEGLNNLNYYFDREMMTVRYDLHLPAGGTGDAIPPDEALYGATVTAPGSSATVHGYRFAGWSRRADAPGSRAEYKAGDEVPVDDHMTLYAIWDVGYQDRYGGQDLIFFPQFEPEVAILERGGVEFRGTREGDAFTFTLPGGTTLEGKAFTDSFAFKRSGINGVYYGYSPYDDPSPDAAPRLNKSVVLRIDEYLGANYTAPYDSDSDGADDATLSIDGVIMLVNEQLAEYNFIVPDGELAGSGFTFRLGEAEGEHVFSESQGEANDYYGFVRIADGKGYVQLSSGASVSLDGFGGIMYTDNETILNGIGEYYIRYIYSYSTGEVRYIIHAEVYESDYDGNRRGDPVSLDFYTIYLDDVEYYAFVACTDNAGGYTGKLGGEDASLELDGYEIFPESAVLTCGETVYASDYTVTQSALGDPTITMAFGDVPHYFTLHEDGTFEEFFPEAREFTEYYLLQSDDLYMPLLVIYSKEEQSGGEVRRRAKLMTQSGGVFVDQAEGYVTVETLGTARHSVQRYTFTRTAILGSSAAAAVINRMTFLVNNVTNGSSNYDVYYILDVCYGDSTAMRPRYSEIASENGKSRILVSDVVEGMGGLYFAENGDVYDGSLSITLDYWGTPIGTFTWIDYAAEAYAYLYFEFELDSVTGAPSAYRPLSELPQETALFEVKNGVMDTEMATVILYGDPAGGTGGNMLYAADGVWDNGLKGTWSVVGTTMLGDDILAFTYDDAIRFYFTWDRILYNDYGTYLEVFRYWRRDYGTAVSEFEKTYQGADGGSITVDGFSRAIRYSADGRQQVGSYYLSGDGLVLYFTATDGTASIFELSEDGFSPLDAAYGYYALTVNGSEYALYFNGRGDVYYMDQTHSQRLGTGTYRILGGLELVVTMREEIVGYGYSFIVRLGGGELTVRSDGEYGVYLDDEWSVLVLDGYGIGTYYPASEGIGIPGYLFVVDSDLDDNGPGATSFAFLRGMMSDDLCFTYWHDEDGTGRFAVQHYSTDYYYYNDNFSDGISFGSDGLAYIGNRMGYYLFTGTGAEVYLLNAEYGDLYMHVSLPLPGPDVLEAPYEYSYISENTGSKVTVTNPGGRTTYYRYSGQERVVLEGTISFEGGVEVGATLTFTPDGSTTLNLPATLTWDDGGTNKGSQRVTFVNRYNASVEDVDIRLEPVIFFSGDGIGGGSYTPFERFVYIPGRGDNGFTGKGGVVESSLYDDYDYDLNLPEGQRVYSTLTTYYYGFGPIRLGEPSLRGELYYLPNSSGRVTKSEDCVVRFDHADPSSRRVIGSDSSNGTRYMLVFTDDKGVQYLLSYYDDGEYFVLYLFGTYSEIAADGYTVGVGRYVYSNAYTFYGNPKRGDATLLVLSKGNSVVTTSFGSGFGPEGKSAWIVDVIPEYNDRTGTITEGHGYLLSLAYKEDGSLSSATVEERKFNQAQATDGLHLFNFFIDGEGKEEIVSMLSYDPEEDLYYFVNVLSAGEEGGVWTVHAADGSVYTLTFVLDGGDRAISVNDNVSWIVEVTSAEGRS